MKKLMLILASTLLITSSTLGTISYKEKTQLQKSPNSHVGAVAEDAEDIANKLFNKLIKIDPNFWLGKNIKEYQKEFNATVVRNRILTQDEIQYVKWGNLDINVAGYFFNKLTFSVTKDGAVATGTSTIDADTGETTAQIATKISKATNIKLNYNYWNTKAVQDNLPALRDILVNDHILTKAEASLITSVNATTITKAGQITLNLTVNDYKISSNASLNTDVVNDGNSAVQIANSLNGYGFGLKTNTFGLYADSSYVMKNFINLAVANYGKNATDLNYVTLPHIKLQKNNPNTPVTAFKDGQKAIAKMDLECRTEPYIYYYIVENNYLQVYVNLNPRMISYLKKYFNTNTSTASRLKYFYQMLDDNQDNDITTYSVPYQISWGNRLDQNMGHFGYQDDTAQQEIKYEAKFSADTKTNFANTLAKAFNNNNGYLSVMFEWFYKYHFIYSNYSIKQFNIW